MDYYLLSLLGGVILIFSLYGLRKERFLFSLSIFFNGYAFLYFFIGYIIYYGFLGGVNADSYGRTILYASIIAVLSFNITYFLFKARVGGVSRPHYRHEAPSTVIIWFFFLVAVAAELYVFFDVGVVHFFSMTRLERFPVLKEYQLSFYIANLVNICLVFSLYGYSYLKTRERRIQVSVILGHNLILSVLLVSRSDLIFTFIALFYFLERSFYFSKKNLAFILAAMVVLTFFYKAMLGSLFHDEYENVTFNPGEYVNWIRNTEIVLGDPTVSASIEINSYLLAMKATVVPSPKEDALSEWFIKKYYPDQYVEGLTYGFSGLVEGYIYNGYFGVVFHYALIAVIFLLLGRNRGVLSTVLTVCALFIMFRLFRSEIYNFSKTFVWYYFYQILIIYFLDKFLRGLKTNKKINK